MTELGAGQLAARLLEKHGCDGWGVRFTNSRRTLAAAHQKTTRKTKGGSIISVDRFVTISREMVKLNDEKEVEAILLHEIAHIKAGLDHHHDAVWKSWARRIGAKPSRVNTTARVPDRQHGVECTLCERIVARRHVRRLKIERYQCNRCGPQSKGKLRWVRLDGKGVD